MSPTTNFAKFGPVRAALIHAPHTNTHGWTDIKPFVAFRFSCERAYKLAPEKNNLLSPQFPANQVLTHHCPYNQSNINVMKAGRLCFVAGINKLGISFSFQIKD